MRHAAFYEKGENGSVNCLLCPHLCVVMPGKYGACAARVNKDGEFYAAAYGRVTALALDPIEKKPLRRFHPGSMILSLGSYGCNFHCQFCQNHSISMGEAPWRDMTPEEVAALSLEFAPRGNIGLSYTYNEPLIGYEFVKDCAVLIREQGQKNVLVTNGFINTEPLLELLPIIDAMNIDIKCFTADYYKALGGDLDSVKATVETVTGACHVEVTTLIIPGKNDSAGEMESLAKWLAGIDRDITLHITRFFPQYKMLDAQPTPLATLNAVADAAKKHLRHVHLGNC